MNSNSVPKNKLSHRLTLYFYLCSETAFSLVRAVAVYLDNHFRKAFNYSCILRLLASNLSDCFVVHHDTFRGGKYKTISHKDPKNPEGKIVRWRGTYLMTCSDDNLAISCMFLCAALRVLRAQRIKPVETHCLIWCKQARMNALYQKFRSMSERRTYGKDKVFHRFDRMIHITETPLKAILGDSACLKEFRLFMLDTFGITPSPPVNTVRRITFIHRGNYDNHIKTRKIANEERLLDEVRRNFPAIEINLASMEKLPLEKQLQIANETDLLVGMHGAGLTHIFFLPENAGLLELFPFHFRLRHTFYTFYAIAAARGLSYERWIQYFPWRDSKSPGFSELIHNQNTGQPETKEQILDYGKDCSTVPPSAIIKRLTAIIRRIEHAGAK